jgi:hypothetical protein
MCWNVNIPSVTAAAELLAPDDDGCTNGCETELIAGSPSVLGSDRLLNGSSSSRVRFLLFFSLLIVAVSGVTVSEVKVSEAVLDRLAFFCLGLSSTAVVHVCFISCMYRVRIVYTVLCQVTVRIPHVRLFVERQCVVSSYL